MIDPAPRPWVRQPPAVGDLADLFDVHVDQLTGSLTFVAEGGLLGGTDHLTGDRVTLAQLGHAVTGQDP
jgi:hypothetical protein